MRNRYKTIKYITTVLLAIWLMVSCTFSARLGEYLMSFSPQALEDEAVIDYYSQDNGSTYTLEPGEVLSLPVHLEKRLSRIGIYVGKQTDSSGKYTFQLEDGYGSILGKTSMRLADMAENQFVYITSRSVISNADTYYLKIFSDDSAHASLNLNVSLAESFQTVSFWVNEKTSEYTLVLDKRYEIDSVKAVIYIDIFFTVVVALVWIFPALKRTRSRQLGIFIKKIIPKLPLKKINFAVILALVAANIILIFAQKTVFVAQGGNSRSREFGESTIPLHEGTVLEQYLHCEDQAKQTDSFSLLFATYTKKIEGGTVYVELWDDIANIQIYSASVETQAILDNQYHHFIFDDPIPLNGNALHLKIQANYESEDDCVAVYVNSNCTPTMFAVKNGEELGQSVIFDFSRQIKLYRTDIALIVNAVLIMVTVLYIWIFLRFEKKIIQYLISAMLMSIFCVFPVMSFLSYHEISMNGMRSCIQDQREWSNYHQFSENELTDRMYRETEYDFAGVPFIAYERIELPIDGGISDVKLQFRGSGMVRKDYDIQIYWNTGNGYHDTQSYTYKYIHQGGNELSFQIPCSEPVRSIMMNVGMTSDRFTGTKLPERIFPLTNLECNIQAPNAQNSFLKIAVVFMGILCFVMFAHLWKYLNWDELLANFLIRKKISISLSFAVFAAILGISMSFLIPTFQVPDEPAHISMLYADIGNSVMGASVVDLLNDQGLIEEVMLNAGQTVDVQAYVEASSEELEDYSLQLGIPSIRVLRRPGTALGVLIGQLLHLPAYWILQLGELGALAIYIAMGALTLKIIPYKKNLMMMIMLLPVAMQEAGSFAYDSFNNALAFLTIAYILHLKVRAEKVAWKQIVVLAALAAGLLIGKIVYVLLLGLVFIVPIHKLELKLGRVKPVIINESWIKQYYIQTVIFIVVGLSACAVGSFALLDRLGYGGIDKLLLGYVSSFPQLIRLCISTCMVHWRIWLRGMVTALGNYDVPVNGVITGVGVVSAFVFAAMHHRKTTNKTFVGQSLSDSEFSSVNLFVWYSVFGTLFVVVLMTMISWGFFIYGIDESLPYSVSMRLLPRIEGVQGRYFYPILPLLLIPIHFKKDVLGFIPAGLYKICYYLLMTVYPISLLLVRYWGIGNW